MGVGGALSREAGRDRVSVTHRKKRRGERKVKHLFIYAQDKMIDGDEEMIV